MSRVLQIVDDSCSLCVTACYAHLMSKHVSFREDEEVVAAVQRAAKTSKRSQSEELKAASRFYLAFIDLATLRAGVLSESAPSGRVYIGEDYRLKMQAAQAFLPSLPKSVREAFERDRGRPLDDSVESLEEMILWALNVNTSGDFAGPPESKGSAAKKGRSND